MRYILLLILMITAARADIEITAPAEKPLVIKLTVGDPDHQDRHNFTVEGPLTFIFTENIDKPATIEADGKRYTHYLATCRHWYQETAKVYIITFTVIDRPAGDSEGLTATRTYKINRKVKNHAPSLGDGGTDGIGVSRESNQDVK